MSNKLRPLRNFGGMVGGFILCAALLSACGGGGAGPSPTAAIDDTQVAEGDVVVTKAALATSLQVSGAIFTTDSTCSSTNGNLFPSKQDVYLDGGPRRIGSAGLPKGDYYVKVTDPSGAMLLGQTPTASVMVDASGNIIGCYQLWAILTPDGLPGPLNPGSYLTTDNPGGEYKVWLSEDPTFPPNRTKTDNFKVGPTTTTPEFGKLSVLKFYDANANGLFDSGETEIIGWKFNLLGLLSGVLGDFFTPYSALLSPDTYTATEYMPIETNWYATKAKQLSVVIVDKSNITVEFGNVCTGAGGGKTLGFWSNKNGAALIETPATVAATLAALRDINLKNGDGSDFDPTTYSMLRSWLLSGTAINMSYMLSVQMTAMQLNVAKGLVSASALVYAPGTTSANLAGFATISALLGEANAELGLHPLVLSGSSYRDYQEALKNAFDKANNNLTFVQATPCAFTF
jgi:hypothetical protein